MKQGFRWGFLKMMVNINSHIVLLQPFSFLSVYFFGHMLSPSFWWDDEVGKGDTAGVWVVADPYQCKIKWWKRPSPPFPLLIFLLLLHSSSGLHLMMREEKTCCPRWWWFWCVCVWGGYHMVHTPMCSARYRSSFYICLTCLFDAPFSISAPTTPP